MRLQVEVSREDEDPLRILAIKQHRSVREQCALYIHLQVQEEWLRLKAEEQAELDPA